MKSLKKRKYIIILSVLILAIFLSSSLSIFAYDYDVGESQVYADNHVFNYNSNFRNFIGADCTNFVSQCMNIGGGLPMSDDWWYYRSWIPFGLGDTWSNSWTVANDHKNWVKDVLKATRLTSKWKKNQTYDSNGNITAWGYINNSSNILGLGSEIVYYDWEDDGYIDHASIVVGTNYSYDENVYGDLINQHTSDRQHTLWHLDTWNRYRGNTAIYVFRIP